MGELKDIPFEEESGEIRAKVTDYWTERADSFFEQKQRELKSIKAERWMGEIKQQMSKVSSSLDGTMKILDVGCGSAFFTVLLGHEGFDVTGIDLTEEMIVKANKMIELNGPYKSSVKAMVMDAERLDFSDESFDVVISRNLTWTLPHPIDAYAQWHRVLKKGGLLLNFDAEYARGAHKLYEDDNLAHKDISIEMKDKCHAIYHMLTISNLNRPAWDKEILKKIGFSEIFIDEDFCERIYSERDEFYIPDRMFMISAVK